MLKEDKDDTTTLASIQVVINNLNTQVAKLEKELADNRKLASLILIQVRAIFAKERAKFEIPPEPVPGALALAQQLVTRSVNVATSNAGAGNNYENPLRPDYNNPIEIVHSVHGSGSYMRFATRDGDLGQQPLPVYSLPCIVTQQPGSVVGKIQVYHSGFMYGIRFLDRAGACVLQAGSCPPSYTLQEIPLEQGERLLAVKSKTYNNGTNNTLHCNPVFVIGRMQ